MAIPPALTEPNWDDPLVRAGIGAMLHANANSAENSSLRLTGLKSDEIRLVLGTMSQFMTGYFTSPLNNQTMQLPPAWQHEFADLFGRSLPDLIMRDHDLILGLDDYTGRLQRMENIGIFPDSFTSPAAARAIQQTMVDFADNLAKKIMLTPALLDDFAVATVSLNHQTDDVQLVQAIHTLEPFAVFDVQGSRSELNGNPAMGVAMHDISALMGFSTTDNVVADNRAKLKTLSRMLKATNIGFYDVLDHYHARKNNSGPDL